MRERNLLKSVTKGFPRRIFFDDFYKSLNLEICRMAKFPQTVLLKQIQRLTTRNGYPVHCIQPNSCLLISTKECYLVIFYQNTYTFLFIISTQPALVAMFSLGMEGNILLYSLGESTALNMHDASRANPLNMCL